MNKLRLNVIFVVCVFQFSQMISMIFTWISFTVDSHLMIIAIVSWCFIYKHQLVNVTSCFVHKYVCKTKSWSTGVWVINCEEQLSQLSADKRPTVGRQMTNCLSTLGRLAVDRRPTVGLQTTDRFFGVTVLHFYQSLQTNNTSFCNMQFASC